MLAKLDRIAPLVADPTRWNFTTRQHPPICNPSIYAAVIFQPILQLQILQDLGCPDQWLFNILVSFHFVLALTD